MSENHRLDKDCFVHGPFMLKGGRLTFRAGSGQLEAEVEKMIRALPDGFDTSDAVTRLAEFLNHDKSFGALIGKWRVAHLTIELLEAESR